jgi:iron complex outermembrane receptor protein
MEGGITTRIGSGELQAVAFHHRLSDAIRRIQLPNGRRQRVNAEEVRSTGLEFLVSQTFGRLGVGGDLTLQSVELIDNSTSASREPENLPEVFGSIHARTPLFLDVNAMVEATYTGTQFCLDLNTGGDSELEAGTWWNADLSRVFSFGTSRGFFSRLEARVSVDNIADTAIYDQCGLPQPGRLVRFQVRLF